MIAAIIQARIGSTRLPGKVLKEVLGKTLLGHLIERLKQSKTLSTIIVATTTEEKDTPLAKHAESLGVRVFRGNEKDVLDRYYKAAAAFNVDTIVRITADCPLMDPAVVDRVVDAYTRDKGTYSYVSNIEPQTFPVGMAVEVISFIALERAWKEATLPEDREHVTLFIRNRPKEFRRVNVENETDYSRFRITVDTPEDFRLVQIIFERFANEKKQGTVREIAQLLESEPELAFINAHVTTALQKRGGTSKDFRQNSLRSAQG